MNKKGSAGDGDKVFVAFKVYCEGRVDRIYCRTGKQEKKKKQG